MPNINQTSYISAQALITPHEQLEDQIVQLENGQIRSTGSRSSFPAELVPDYSGHYLIPGMIDIHINGAGGGDAATGSADDLRKMSETLAAHGCTAFNPTIITGHKPDLVTSLEKLSDVLAMDYPGAVPLGIHLEGPFLSPEKAGVHRVECIQPPTISDFEDYFQASDGRMKMLTLAPEMPGALEVISAAREKLPIVSLGHTNSDYDTCLEAIKVGANLVTHLFNAMASLHHRRPGLLGAAMLTEGISVEFIPDGIHVHPEVVKILFRTKGSGEVILTTDAMSAAAMPDGIYVLGNLEAHVKDGVCRDANGVLAGSAVMMDTGLQNLKKWMVDQEGSELSAMVATGTSQPAALMGLSTKGEIKTGFDADLVLLDEDLKVEKTWVGGKLVFDRQMV